MVCCGLTNSIVFHSIETKPFKTYFLVWFSARGNTY